MTRQELAGKLNGRQYGSETEPEEEKSAREEGLLIIFGYSDDLMELRGAINDEVGAWKGATIAIKDGVMLPPIEDDDEEILSKHHVLNEVRRKRDHATLVTAKFSDGEYTWSYETSAPHSTFDILEEEEKYCRGIVIDLKELES